MKSKFLIIATVLALILCLSLAACSVNNSSNEKPSENTENASAQPDVPNVPSTTPEPKEVAVGTMLDKPEKALELEEFYVSVMYPDDENESGVKTLEIALKDKDEPGILYISDGILKLHEMVYELSSAGDVVKYTKDVFAEKFAKDEETSAESLLTEVVAMQELLSEVGYGFVEMYPEAQYKKCEDVKLPYTGEAYKYEVYAENELVGIMCVDKQTGIFVKMTNPDGTDIMKVTSIKTTDFDIPEYK